MTLSVLGEQHEEDDSADLTSLTWEKPYFYYHGKKFIPRVFDARFLGEEPALIASSVRISVEREASDVTTDDEVIASAIAEEAGVTDECLAADRKLTEEAIKAEAPPSKDFNAVTVVLDGRCNSELNWSEAIRAAKQYVASGLLIFWELELGLFGQLKHPLSNQTQFLSLTLSFKHFIDTIWKEFGEHSLGLSFYRGRTDFYQSFKWDAISQQNFDSLNRPDAHAKQLFCRDAVLEYFDLITASLPDSLPLFLMLDTEHTTEADVGRLLTHPFVQRFHILIRGGRTLNQEMQWERHSDYGYIGNRILPAESSQVNIGICLNSLEDHAELEALLQQLKQSQKKYRFIAEEALTMEWDGLDYLIVFSKIVSKTGLRKLQGFCAAGGTVVLNGKSLGLPQELDFKEWYQHDISN